MTDQNSIDDSENKRDKWNRGLDLFIESQRTDLLRLIENQNEESREILKAKSSGESLSECETEKIDIWRKIRYS